MFDTVHGCCSDNCMTFAFLDGNHSLAEVTTGPTELNGSMNCAYNQITIAKYE